MIWALQITCLQYNLSNPSSIINRFLNYQYNISQFIITCFSKYPCDTRMFFNAVTQAENEDKHNSSALLNISFKPMSSTERCSGNWLMGSYRIGRHQALWGVGAAHPEVKDKDRFPISLKCCLLAPPIFLTAISQQYIRWNNNLPPLMAV